MKKFFIIKYQPDGVGSPYYFEEEWSPATPREYCQDFDANKFPFLKKYYLEIDVEEISADLIMHRNLASKATVDILEKIGAVFLKIPIDLSFKKSKSIEKKYYIIYPLERIELMDDKKSIYVADTNIEPYKTTISADDMKYFYPPKIWLDTIDLFIPKDSVNINFFFCEEIREIVCSNEFRDLFIANGLTGADFEPIDQNYKKIPFSPFST